MTDSDAGFENEASHHRFIAGPSEGQDALVCDVENVGYGDSEIRRFDYCPACGNPLDPEDDDP